MSSFTVSLPSNASTDLFPENKLSHFRVQLANRILLSPGLYEVGLSQISFVNNILTLNSKNNDHVISCKKDYDGKLVELPHIKYDTITQLVKIISHLLRAAFVEKTSPQVPGRENNNEGEDTDSDDGIKKKEDFFLYDKSIHRVIFYRPKFNAARNQYDIEISEKLASILGFEQTLFEGRTKHLVADYAPDLMAGAHNMFVYCNLIRPQYIGDKMGRLLRILPLTGDDAQSNNINFNPPYFYPLELNEIDTIEIKLCNEIGEPIHFQTGSVIVTLLFHPT